MVIWKLKRVAEHLHWSDLALSNLIIHSAGLFKLIDWLICAFCVVFWFAGALTMRLSPADSPSQTCNCTIVQFLWYCWQLKSALGNWYSSARHVVACVPENELQVGLVSSLHKRQIGVSNFFFSPCSGRLSSPSVSTLRKEPLCSWAKIITPDCRNPSKAACSVAHLYLCWSGNCGDSRKRSRTGPAQRNQNKHVCLRVSFLLNLPTCFL